MKSQNAKREDTAHEGPARQQPSDLEAERARIADLLGRLLASFWLRECCGPEDITPKGPMHSDGETS